MSKDQYGQQYPQQPQQYGQQPYPTNQVVHTTVVVREDGCCSLRARVQWVAALNLVSLL